MRCLVHVWVISQRLGISDKTLRQISIATSIHDCRRLNDKGDAMHGKRAKDWFEVNSKDISEVFGRVSQDEQDQICYIVENHEIPQNEYIKCSEYEKSLQILKLADALDRYRQPKLKWRINTKYLDLKPDLKELIFAYELVVASEDNFLNGKSSYESIISSIKHYAK